MSRYHDTERAISFLQSIAIQAVEAQEALRRGDAHEVAELLDAIESDLYRATEFSPGPK